MTLSSSLGAVGLLRQIAEELVTAAAELIQQQRALLGDLNQHAQTKSSVVDPVTVVDTATEEFIVQRLEQLRPDDGIIGEEGASKPSKTGISWVIDPIDGTVNFLYGLPQYAVSVAAAVENKPVAGAVINVATGELFSAAEGEGASVRIGEGPSSALRASSATEIRKALLATGFSYSALRRSQQIGIVAELMPQVRDIRRMGSAALDLCALAAGRVDVYYEHGIHAWDYAAGVVIATEAGAVLSYPGLNVPGGHFLPVIGVAPGLESEIWPLLSDVGVTSALDPLA